MVDLFQKLSHTLPRNRLYKANLRLKLESKFVCDLTRKMILNSLKLQLDWEDTSITDNTLSTLFQTWEVLDPIIELFYSFGSTDLAYSIALIAEITWQLRFYVVHIIWSSGHRLRDWTLDRVHLRTDWFISGKSVASIFREYLIFNRSSNLSFGLDYIRSGGLRPWFKSA